MPGSGGFPASTDNLPAGAGGGVLELTVSNSLTLNGRVSADGQHTGYTYYGSATDLSSGAGGSVSFNF